MIKLGNHLSKSAKAKLVQIVLSALLKEKPKTISKKLGIDPYSVYAIRRGLTCGTAGYARSVYKGEKSYTEIQIEFAGYGKRAQKRTIQEAYRLVGGSLVDLHTIDLTEFVNPNPQKSYIRKRKSKDINPEYNPTPQTESEKRAASFVHRQILQKEFESKQIENTKEELKPEPIHMEYNSYETPSDVSPPKNEIIKMEQTHITVGGRSMTILKPVGVEIIVTFK